MKKTPHYEAAFDALGHVPPVLPGEDPYIILTSKNKAGVHHFDVINENAIKVSYHGIMALLYDAMLKVRFEETGSYE